MADERLERRLAAILAADVAGYSRLIGDDEEGTHTALKRLRRSLIDPKIAEHRGRVVKNTGDGALIEFASALDAVRCATEIQRAMAESNVDVPTSRRIEFRLGINVGDVIFDEGDIYGDGVNVAARVQNLAKAGGICLSDNAYQQVKGKLAVEVSDMGEQRLKNIARPVRVYNVRLSAPASRLAPASVENKGSVEGHPPRGDRGTERVERPLDQEHRMKILLVDDHVLIRDALRSVLREVAADAEVLEAADCGRAMRLIEEHPDLHLILLDLNLPDRDGFAVLNELRQRHATISLVVLSALQDRETVVKVLDLGALGFIPKSAPRDVMVSALRLVFAGGIYIPPEALGRTEPKERPSVSGRPVLPADLGFTERQMEVLALIMQGKSNKAISRILDVAEPTVKHHVTAILKALNVASRTEAVIAVGSLGWKLPQIADR
jgi:DNA-binding NarL/FixJ family response regulator/class 3 adenylate cyclase